MYPPANNNGHSNPAGFHRRDNPRVPVTNGTAIFTVMIFLSHHYIADFWALGGLKTKASE